MLCISVFLSLDIYKLLIDINNAEVITKEVMAANEEQTAYIHQIRETANRLEQLVENLKNIVKSIRVGKVVIKAVECL